MFGPQINDLRGFYIGGGGLYLPRLPEHRPAPPSGLSWVCPSFFSWPISIDLEMGQVNFPESTFSNECL